jgi:hypothetical protein
MGLFGKLFSKRGSPELERAIQHYSKQLMDLEQHKDSEEPMDAGEAANLGAEIWKRLCDLNAKFESRNWAERYRHRWWRSVCR